MTPAERLVEMREIVVDVEKSLPAFNLPEMAEFREKASRRLDALRAAADALDALEKLEWEVKDDPILLHHGWDSAGWPSHPRGLTTVYGIANAVRKWPMKDAQKKSVPTPPGQEPAEPVVKQSLTTEPATDAKYRLGQSLGTTIYRTGEPQPCAWVANNPELAGRIVGLLNGEPAPDALGELERWRSEGDRYVVISLIGTSEQQTWKVSLYCRRPSGFWTSEHSTFSTAILDALRKAGAHA